MNSRRVLVVAATAVTLATLLATVAISSETGLWKLVLVAVALGLPGAICAALHPHNSAGWLLLAVGLLFACMSLATQLIESGHEGPWAAWVADRSGAIVVPLTFLALLLLPDGRLPSPRWRPVAVAVVVAQVGVVTVWSLVSGTRAEPNPIGVLPASWERPVDTVGDWTLQLPLLVVLMAIVVRLRRQPDRGRLAGVVGGAAVFAVLALAGRLAWPSAADSLDVVGAMVLGAGLTATLVREPDPVAGEAPAAEAAELSQREREVLVLVAEGLTNRQIAERLVISPVTARNHVSSILTKLGLENRTQAATWLARRATRRPAGPSSLLAE